MPLFKDRAGRYVFLHPDHVSAIAPGGHEGMSLVYLRGGQQMSINGSVLDTWRLLMRPASPDIDAPVNVHKPDPAVVQTEAGEASADMDSGGAG